MISLARNIEIKGATSQLACLEKFSPNFSSSSFAIRFNLPHPQQSLFRYGLLLAPCCKLLFSGSL